MPKPIKETFLARVFRLLYGIVFYNTVYWKRASDGLQPPKLSRQERDQIRPVRDLNVIRPRANPRAKLETADSATPDASAPVIVPEAILKATANMEVPGSPAASHASSGPKKIHVVPMPAEIHKGKRKRRHLRQAPAKGFFAKWFS